MDPLLKVFYVIAMVYVLFNLTCFYILVKKTATDNSWGFWKEYKLAFENNVKAGLYATLIVTITPIAFFVLKEENGDGS